MVSPVVLYGREIWYLTLREERGLRSFGNRVSREIFRRERDEVSGDRRKRTEDFHHMYFSPNII